MNVEDLFEDEAHDRDEDDPDEEGNDQVNLSTFNTIAVLKHCINFLYKLLAYHSNSLCWVAHYGRFSDEYIITSSLAIFTNLTKNLSIFYKLVCHCCSLQPK